MFYSTVKETQTRSVNEPLPNIFLRYSPKLIKAVIWTFQNQGCSVPNKVPSLNLGPLSLPDLLSEISGRNDKRFQQKYHGKVSQVFPELKTNSVNSGNRTNHWSIKRCHFKDNFCFLFVFTKRLSVMHTVFLCMRKMLSKSVKVGPQTMPPARRKCENVFSAHRTKVGKSSQIPFPNRPRVKMWFWTKEQ